MARREVRRGEFITADGGKVTMGKDTSRIKRGAFMTSDAVVERPAILEKRFPEMAGAIEAAGAPLTTRQLAEHWQRQADLEERFANLKTKIRSAKKR